MSIISSLVSDKFLLFSLLMAVLLVMLGNPALAFIAAAATSLWPTGRSSKTRQVFQVLPSDRHCSSWFQHERR